MLSINDPNNPLNKISEKIRDSAFRIHRAFGPGLLESAYEKCLIHDLIRNHNLTVEYQKELPIHFENIIIPNAYRLDLFVENQIIVEVKACEKVIPIYQAQILTYMKLTGVKLGYIINFNEKLIKDGIYRFVL